MRLGNAVYILAQPCAQLSIRGPIAKEKRENRHWELPISLPHAHIPRGKQNAQMTFCKITNWRAPALGKLCVFVFISSICPNVSRCHFLCSCGRPCVHQSLCSPAGSLHRGPGSWLWSFSNASDFPYKCSTGASGSLAAVIDL